MVKAAAVFTFVAVLMVGLVPGAQALVITDTSWSWSCIAGCGGSGAAVEVNPLAIPWAPETTGQWISSVNATTVPLGAIIEFTKDVDFGSGAGSILTMKVWADDTAGVSLDGGALAFLNPGSAPNFAQDGSCAAGGLGCEASEFGEFQSGSLTGVHTLRVQVYQLVAGTSFGTLVEGDLAAVPEPTTILLLGSALATAGVVSRRRFRKGGSDKA